MNRDTTPSIEPGQVWRARWDDVVTFVFIDTVLHEFADRVRVAPVSFGDEDADDTAVILSSDASALDIPLSVWPTMVTDISGIVLDRWIAAVSDFHTVADLERAAAEGVLVRGLPIRNDMSPRWEERRLLELAIKVLASAADIAGGTGHLSSLLSGVPTSELATMIDVPPALARNIKHARALVDFAQAERLALVLNIPVDGVLQANPSPPVELVRLATSFIRGPQLRALAALRNETDSDALVELVQGAWGLAARGDKLHAEDWNGRLNTYLAMTLTS